MKSPDRGPTGGVRDAEERDAHARRSARRGANGPITMFPHAMPARGRKRK